MHQIYVLKKLIKDILKIMQNLFLNYYMNSKNTKIMQCKVLNVKIFWFKTLRDILSKNYTHFLWKQVVSVYQRDGVEKLKPLLID